MPFQKATKESLYLRLALQGPSGSGKTRSALDIGAHLGDRLALIDTEERSSCRYAHLYDFDVQHLSDHHPNQYIGAIREARGQYDVLVIDSFSHAWFWELEAVDKNFKNWSAVRPVERQLLKAILSFPGHVIVTMRSKTEWLLEEGTNKNGKSTTIPKKVGTAPIQSPGTEYEFDVVGELDLQHVLRVTKSRFDGLDGIEVSLPGKEFAAQLLQSLLEGGDPVPPVDLAVERDRLMEQIDAELTRLQWDTDQARTCLQQHFNKKSRRALSDAQLVEFLQALQAFADSDTSAPAEHLPTAVA